MYLVHWEDVHIPKEEQGASGGGLANLDPIVDGMENLAVTAFGTPRATASLEFINNFSVRQAEDVGQAEAPVVPPFPEQYHTVRADDDLPDYDDA